MDLHELKSIPILNVAERLGIQVRGTKAKCFEGHDLASPSLSFLRSRNTWRCFGACGKHGDNISLVMAKLNVSFKEAVKWLANEFRLKVPRETTQLSYKKGCFRLISKKHYSKAKPKEENEFVSDPELYAWLVSKCASVSSPIGLDYLKSHGITQSVAKTFELRELRDPNFALKQLTRKWGKERVYRSGLAWGACGQPERLIWNSYAILFPFYEKQKIKYIQARMFSGDKKFLNLRGIPKPLFNAGQLEEFPIGSLVHLCEGVPDAISLESQGLNAVGVLGATSFRAEWVDRFLHLSVVLLGDGDAAGEKFQTDISKLFEQRAKAVRCMQMPPNKDVAQVLATIGEKT